MKVYVVYYDEDDMPVEFIAVSKEAIIHYIENSVGKFSRYYYGLQEVVKIKYSGEERNNTVHNYLLFEGFSKKGEIVYTFEIWYETFELVEDYVKYPE